MYQIFNLPASCAGTYQCSRRRVWVLAENCSLHWHPLCYQFCLGGGISHHRGACCGSSGSSSEVSAHHYGRELELSAQLRSTGGLQGPTCVNCCANCRSTLFARSVRSTPGRSRSLRAIQIFRSCCWQCLCQSQPHSLVRVTSSWRVSLLSLGFPWLQEPPRAPRSSAQPRILPSPHLPFSSIRKSSDPATRFSTEQKD